jgi:hypothetical protein
MKKEIYQDLDIQVILFGADDIITASGDTGTPEVEE